MMAATRKSGLPFVLVLIAAVASAVVCFVSAGAMEEALLELTRLTARLSVLFFIAAFAASALFAFWPSGLTRALLQNRRNIGLAFALAHFIHLGVLVAYFGVSGEDPGLARIIGGGLGYMLIALMAATSNDWSARRLGRNWNRLHTVGGWYVWLIFLNSYLGRVMEGREPVFLFGGITALLVIAALLKIVTRLRRQS